MPAATFYYVKPQRSVNRNTNNKIPNTEITNTVETSRRLFLKSLHEESVQVATGVEVRKSTNFFFNIIM